MCECIFLLCSSSSHLFFPTGVGIGSDSLPGADTEHEYEMEVGAPQSRVSEERGVIPQVVVEHPNAPGLLSEPPWADFQEPEEDVEVREELRPLSEPWADFQEPEEEVEGQEELHLLSEPWADFQEPEEEVEVHEELGREIEVYHEHEQEPEVR
jgi:hypothetical protein